MLLSSLRRRGGLLRLSPSSSTVPKHSAPSVLSFLQWVPFRLLSAVHPNEDSPTVSLLVQSLGFSPEAALSLYTSLRSKEPKNVGPVISFFRGRGFSADQISRMIRSSPRLLLLHPERTLMPKLDFFGSKGLSGRGLIEFLSSNSHILTRSLHGCIIPHFNLLRSILKSDAKALQATRRLNRYIHGDTTTAAANIQYLRDIGVPLSNFPYLLQCGPRVLYRTQAQLRETVRGLKEMGIDPENSNFRHALMAVLGMTKSTWESKVRVYRSWGWNEEELLSAFMKYPLCMATSEDKINRVMSFFVDRMEWKPSLIAEHPILLGKSLEKKIIPRASVLQFLLSIGLFDKNHSSVVFLYVDEKAFLKRLSRYSVVAPRVLEIYEEEQNKPR